MLPLPSLVSLLSGTFPSRLPYADGKVDCAAAVQRARENLRITCAILREARQACAGEVNCAVHRNGRGLQTVQFVFRNTVDHRVVAVGLPGDRKFGEILN